MKKFRLILIFVLIVILVGCSSPNKLMNSWTGKNISELYSSWGYPTCTAPDGKGGTVVSYYFDDGFALIKGIKTKNSDGTISCKAPDHMTYSAARHFYADSKGVIYSWFYKGK